MKMINEANDYTTNDLSSDLFNVVLNNDKADTSTLRTEFDSMFRQLNRLEEDMEDSNKVIGEENGQNVRLIRTSLNNIVSEFMAINASIEAINEAIRNIKKFV
jgi:hypothetical protein